MVFIPPTTKTMMYIFDGKVSMRSYSFGFVRRHWRGGLALDELGNEINRDGKNNGTIFLCSNRTQRLQGNRNHLRVKNMHFVIAKKTCIKCTTMYVQAKYYDAL